MKIFTFQFGGTQFSSAQSGNLVWNSQSGPWKKKNVDSKFHSGFTLHCASFRIAFNQLHKRLKKRLQFCAQQTLSDFWKMIGIQSIIPCGFTNVFHKDFFIEKWPEPNHLGDFHSFWTKYDLNLINHSHSCFDWKMIGKLSDFHSFSFWLKLYQMPILTVIPK